MGKALTQQQNDSFDIGKALGLNGNDDDEKNELMDNDPMQMLMKTMNQFNNASNGNNLFDDDFKSTNLVESDDDDDDEEQMHYIQIKRVLSRMKLGKYAANFINNGIKTMQQMMEIDPSFIPLLIENQKDQNKFVEFIKKR